MCEFGITLDERIGGGYYFAKSCHMIEYLLQHPEMLEEAPPPWTWANCARFCLPVFTKLPAIRGQFFYSVSSAGKAGHEQTRFE